MSSLPCQCNKSAEGVVSLPSSFEREFMRKLLHLPVFLFPLIAIYSVAVAVAALLFLSVCYIAALTYERLHGKSIPILSTIISSCRRNIGCDFGPLYLALGMIVALSISTPQSVFFAAYVIAICDSAASLTGIQFGKSRIPMFGKSYVGSFTFFILCLFGGIYFFSPLNLLAVALILTMVELVSVKGLDNFTLPITAQLLILILR